MGERIQAIRGMNDILPQDTPYWRFLEQKWDLIVSSYGYHEIRFPFLEQTALFKRSIGDVTDIVEKEMYTFNDLNGDSLTLRPEGTAGCVRACLEHGLLHRQSQKLWYCGPMFRHEKPQKGRYRQFHQLGAEAFGIAGVEVELELILIALRFFKALGMESLLTLQINTIGTVTERDRYRRVLIDYFKPHIERLDNDSKRRLERSPLRILDSKNPELQSLIAAAPHMSEVMSDDSRQRFSDVCQGLDALHIPYTVNPLLVRGLDYYGHLVFEWVTDALGSQATVCAGGRYDKLVEHLGGAASDAVGFAIGMERLLLLRTALDLKPWLAAKPSVFIATMGAESLQRALILAETLRNETSMDVVVNLVGGSFKSQFKKADKSGAQFAIVIGEEECCNHTVTIKDLRQSIDQQTIPQDALVSYLLSHV